MVGESVGIYTEVHSKMVGESVGIYTEVHSKMVGESVGIYTEVHILELLNAEVQLVIFTVFVRP